MRESRFQIPDEHVFPVSRTSDGIPYVRLEDVRQKLGDGKVISLELFIRDRTSLTIGGERVVCLWDLNDFLKIHVPVATIPNPVKVL